MKEGVIMTIEYYYNNGDMPLKYYCQLNGKSATENYMLFKKQDSRNQNDIEKWLGDEINTVIEKLFSSFK